jgi:tRNA modification GTPase
VDIEASIDYPEYDVEEVTNEKTLNILEMVENQLKELEKTFENGKIIKERNNTCNNWKTKCRKVFIT